MASFIYNVAKRNLLRSTTEVTGLTHHWNWEDHSGLGAGARLRVALLIKTTASGLPGLAQDKDHGTVQNCLDQTGYLEYDAGGSYARQDMSAITLATDDGEDEVEISAANLPFGSPLAASENLRGVLMYFHNTDDLDSFPVAWMEGGNVQTTNGNGQTMLIKWPGLFAALQDV